MENVHVFTDFVHAFSQFGADMVELAHVSGDRQNVNYLHAFFCNVVFIGIDTIDSDIDPKALTMRNCVILYLVINS